MRRYQIDVTAPTEADPGAVYALLREGATWPRWSVIDSFALEREGKDEPEGVGAVRLLRNGRILGHDEITGFTKDRSFSYAHTSSLPVRDYRGEVTLTPVDGGGTTIHWRVSYFPKYFGTGWFLRLGLTRFITGMTRGLASYATANRASIG
jgi:hypothetical protein